MSLLLSKKKNIIYGIIITAFIFTNFYTSAIENRYDTLACV